MATDHRGNPLHAGKRTDDEFFLAPRPSQRVAAPWDPKRGQITYGPNTAPPAGSKTVGEIEQEKDSHLIGRFDEPNFQY